MLKGVMQPKQAAHGQREANARAFKKRSHSQGHQNANKDLLLGQKSTTPEGHRRFRFISKKGSLGLSQTRLNQDLHLNNDNYTKYQQSSQFHSKNHSESQLSQKQSHEKKSAHRRNKKCEFSRKSMIINYSKIVNNQKKSALKKFYPVSQQASQSRLKNSS